MLKEARIIVAGGRRFANYPLLKHKMDVITKNLRESGAYIQIVSGKAPGVDTLGEKWARQRGVTVKEFPADWESHGKRAGYIRNKQMAEYGTHLVAFWDGSSPGTKLMIELAKEHGLTVRVIRYA